MPGYLVERINTSLAAEQAQRTTGRSGTTATPLLAGTRGRPARLLFTIAGAAAAVALVAVLAGNLFTVNQPTATSGSAALASTSRTESAGEGAPSDAAQAPSAGAAAAAADRVPTPSLVQIAMSGTPYTQADFVRQARALDQSPPPGQIHPRAAKSSGIGPAGTTDGLLRCLSAVGGAGAQVVRADVASYEGQPAVIIVATRDGASMAYVVGRQCSSADPAVLRPATPLP